MEEFKKWNWNPRNRDKRDEQSFGAHKHTKAEAV
jgi:hypothetical protein